MRIKQLRKAEQMVVSDPGIMGGTPVFRGTRIPLNAITEMLDAGASIDEILEGYPSLTLEKLNLAKIYSQAHPYREQPRQQPWSKVKPSKVICIPLVKPLS